MRFGLNVGYWGLGMTAEEQLDLVKEAEDAGFDSVWAAEAYGSDAATVLAWLAAQTERIRIGSAIFQMPARSPAMTAMTAATLDQLSGGRMLLGIGTSGPQVAEGWHGQRFGKQLGRTREYVEILRKALARERLEYDGENYQLPLPDGPGKALKLMIAPVQERIPIYIAAIGPKNTQLTGEIADGWLPIFFSPEHVDESRALLEEGAARAGRTLGPEFDIAPTVNVASTTTWTAPATRCATSSRSTWAAWARARRTSTTRSCSATGSRTPPRDPGPLSRRQEGRGGRGAARRADRHGHARRPARQGARPARGVSRRGRRDADRVAGLVRHGRAQADGPRPGGDALSRRFLLAAFGDPGHAFPAIALGAELARRGHEVTLETWSRWRRARGARGHALRGRAGVPGLSRPARCR